MTQPKATYQSLSAELDDVMAQLQADDIDIEVAVKAYERGMHIVAELEKQLKTAENKVKKIKLQFEK
jgi:exodeoxyribonuclease VII small subunit